MTDVPPKTGEEMIQLVNDKIRDVINHVRTKEDVQKSRTNILDVYDDATAHHIEEAEKCGADIGEMEMTAEFRFNKKLGAWELQGLEHRYPMVLPHPIKRLYGVYNVNSDEKFWDRENKDGTD